MGSVAPAPPSRTPITAILGHHLLLLSALPGNHGFMAWHSISMSVPQYPQQSKPSKKT